MSVSPKLGPGTWLAASLVQRLLPMIRTPRAFRFATRHVEAAQAIDVPTRHGDVRCLIYQPPVDGPETRSDTGLPVVLHLHGGAFIVRNPRQEEYIASYIASEVGAVVVLPDYATAPQARYPVAEQQAFDIAMWIRAEAAGRGWDAARMSVTGASAGAKLAVNVCQQLYHAGEFTLRAAVLAFPVVDLSRTDRTSVKKYARIPPLVQRLAVAAYVADPGVCRETLASPIFDTGLAAAMPPSLILTGDLDTLGPEGDQLASQLAANGVPVTHHRYPNTDHGFRRSEAETARHAMTLIGSHLTRYLG